MDRQPTASSPKAIAGRFLCLNPSTRGALARGLHLRVLCHNIPTPGELGQTVLSGSRLAGQNGRPAMISTRETVLILKGLMVACHGIEQACNSSAEEAKDSRLKSGWLEVAWQQGNMASELEQVIARLGGNPRHGGLVGDGVSLWTSTNRIDGVEKPATAVLTGSREDVQRQAYRRALQADLPLHVHMLVQRQYVEISAAAQRMQRLQQAVLEQEETERVGGNVKAKLSRTFPRATTMWFDF